MLLITIKLMNLTTEHIPIICAIIEIKEMYDVPTTEFKHNLRQPLTDLKTYSIMGRIILIMIRWLI